MIDFKKDEDVAEIQSCLLPNSDFLSIGDSVPVWFREASLRILSLRVGAMNLNSWSPPGPYQIVDDDSRSPTKT